MPPLQSSISFLPPCSYGRNLKRIRLAAPIDPKFDPPGTVGWSTRKLSLISGIPEDVIRRIEDENLPPNWHVACRLADVLKADLEAFKQ